MSAGARRALLAAFAAVIVLWPLTGRFWSFVGTVAVVSSLVCLSLVVLTGRAGQLSLHHLVFAGWGAYAAVALSRLGLPVVLAVPLSTVAVVPFALVAGSFLIRLNALQSAVATLALGLIFERSAFRTLTRVLGERTTSTQFEVASIPLPRPAIGGFRFADDRWFFLFAAALAALAFWCVAVASRRVAGRVVIAVRSAPAQAEVLGIPTSAYRLGAFVAAVSIAALAGAISGSLSGAVTENPFRLDESLRLFAAAVLGGIASPTGAVVGGVLAAFLPQLAGFEALGFLGGDNLLVVFGAGMVAVFAFLPRGLVQLPERLGLRPSQAAQPPLLRPASAARSARPAAAGEWALRLQDVEVRFGGVHALDGVTIGVKRGHVAALIGPNGAGKTTLFNVASGLVVAQAGRVYLGDDDVTGMAPGRRARLGLGRTFQAIALFPDLSVAEHLGLTGPRGVRAAADVDAIVPSGLLDKRPADLAFGELRRLELALALQARPRVLLLDEPSAGLDEDETAWLIGAIRTVAAGEDTAVLFVEHDMAVVGSMADSVFVLDFGRVIASGSPDEVRSDPRVVDAYLGQGLEELAGG